MTNTLSATYPLSSYVPLRTTAAWPYYEEIKPLPIGYGTVTIQPIRYNASGSVLFLFDHPIAGVDRVMIDGNPAAFNFYNALDHLGFPCSFVSLTTPVTTTAGVEVTARGKMHQTTGMVLTHPADVIADIMAIARSTYSESNLDVFRRECNESGLNEISGVLDNNQQTTRAYLDEIALSLGAVWSGAMPGLFRLFPRTMPADEPIWQEYDEKNTSGVSCSASIRDYYSVLKIKYAWNYATGTPAQAMTLSAIEPTKTRRVDHEIELKWMHRGRLVYGIGSRLLQHRSRSIWHINFDSGFDSQGYSTITHPLIPVSDTSLVLSRTVSPMRPGGSYEMQIAAGAVPVVEILQRSENF